MTSPKSFFCRRNSFCLHCSGLWKNINDPSTSLRYARDTRPVFILCFFAE